VLLIKWIWTGSGRGIGWVRRGVLRMTRRCWLLCFCTRMRVGIGQIKYNRRVDQFMRRGRAAVHSEMGLVAATHNLLKLHTHWIANTA
jgi:hypothetical protein